MAKPSVSPNDIGLLILRLTLGAIFLVHGIPKLLGLEEFSQALAGVGLQPSYPLAVVAAVAEAGGGALLIVGWFPRLAALGLASVVLMAIVFFQGEQGVAVMVRATTEEVARWNDPEGGHLVPGVEYNVVLLAMCLHLALVGGGKIVMLKSGGTG